MIFIMSSCLHRDCQFYGAEKASMNGQYVCGARASGL
jgi:hypothetical protein